MVLLIIVFLTATILSAYHFGIEQGFFEESSVCGLKNGANIISKEELLNLLSQKTISCKDETFMIFGKILLRNTLLLERT